MNQRVRELRKTLGLTMEKFGQRIGVGKTAISKIEHNQCNLTDQMILLICHEFNVNEDWLRTGFGEMFVPDTNDELTALAEKYNLSPMAYKAIEKFAKMDEDKQQVLLNYYIEVAAAITAEKSGMSIDEKVADYRRQLELEAVSQGKSSALQNDA